MAKASIAARPDFDIFIIGSTGDARRCRAGRTVQMLALSHAIMILAVAAVLFVGVHWLEPNHRLALVLKLAILAAGAVAIVHLLP